MMTRKRVLVTCVGGDATPALLLDLRSDRQISLVLIGVDVAEPGLAEQFLEAFYQVPQGDSADYVENLLKIAVREQVDIVVPLSDEEAISLSQARDHFDVHGIDVLASPVGVMDIIRDKEKVYACLEDAGVQAPSRVTVETKQQLHEALTRLDFPKNSLVVKPTTGRGGRGTCLLCGDDNPPAWIGTGRREQRLDSLPEQLSAWFELGPLMVMPLLSAPVYDVDIFAVDGDIQYCLARQRHNPVGIPFVGNDIIIDADLEAYCVQIAQVLRLDGLHDIDLMTGPDGTPCLLEVNPRPSGSIVAAHSAGYPVLTAAIAYRLGVEYDMVRPKTLTTVSFFPRPWVRGEL